MTSPRALASYWLTVGASGIAALINAVFGMLSAWVLVRYQFPGRRFADALIDLPLALPTAVAGIALTSLYAENGWLGSILAKAGIKAAFTPLGIVIALTFIGLPFVVRTVQPVLQDLENEVEDAAASLGATRGADIPADHPADRIAGARHGHGARVRARPRRIRFHRLHLGQPALEDRGRQRC